MGEDSTYLDLPLVQRLIEDHDSLDRIEQLPSTLNARLKETYGCCLTLLDDSDNIKDSYKMLLTAVSSTIPSCLGLAMSMLIHVNSFVKVRTVQKTRGGGCMLWLQLAGQM
jgi:hypothetical protein